MGVIAEFEGYKVNIASTFCRPEFKNFNCYGIVQKELFSWNYILSVVVSAKVKVKIKLFADLM